MLANAGVRFQLTKHLRVTADVRHLLDAKTSDIDYFFAPDYRESLWRVSKTFTSTGQSRARRAQDSWWASSGRRFSFRKSR